MTVTPGAGPLGMPPLLDELDDEDEDETPEEPDVLDEVDELWISPGPPTQPVRSSPAMIGAGSEIDTIVRVRANRR
jgi:hypothetical protein